MPCDNAHHPHALLFHCFMQKTNRSLIDKCAIASSIPSGPPFVIRILVRPDFQVKHFSHRLRSIWSRFPRSPGRFIAGKIYDRFTSVEPSTGDAKWDPVLLFMLRLLSVLALWRVNGRANQQSAGSAPSAAATPGATMCLSRHLSARRHWSGPTHWPESPPLKRPIFIALWKRDGASLKWLRMTGWL